jgi:hypothetical protein
MQAVPTGGGLGWDKYEKDCLDNTYLKDESYYMKNGNGLWLCNRNKATPTIDWSMGRPAVIAQHKKSGLPKDFYPGWDR